MSDVEARLLTALLELESVAQSVTPSQPGPSLLSLFARIDELAGRLPAGADPELRHFLQRKSYQKARQRLQGAAAARGTCGH